MEWMDQSTVNCSVQRALETVGEKWTFVVLRELFNGARRFDEIQRHSGVSKPVLARRLTTLVEQALLMRVPYQEPGQRERQEYQLTQKGLDLYPALSALRDWGDRYLADPEGPARVVKHRGCGATVHASLVCDDGHHIESLEEVSSIAGPGARAAVSG
jgi:DNA-binding HxlR family transcriptional regulator